MVEVRNHLSPILDLSKELALGGQPSLRLWGRQRGLIKANGGGAGGGDWPAPTETT